MSRWTKRTVALSLLAGSIATGSSAAYAASTSTSPAAANSVFINGQAQSSTLIINGRTLVQLRALNDPEWLTYSYDAKAHTVKATSKDKSKIIELKENEKTATVNGKTVTLDTSVIIRDGKTYVPIRFVGENMGAYVSYNAAKKRTVVRTPQGQADYKTLMSGDVAAARAVAVKLPLSLADGALTEHGEGFSTTYRFPVGEVLRFEREYKQLMNSVQIDSDGIAVVVYQKDNLASSKVKEKGVKPKALGDHYYFIDNWMGETVVYGKTDAQGKGTELGSISRVDQPEYKNKVIVPIEGESRTAGK